jgi:hypothetical protein
MNVVGFCVPRRIVVVVVFCCLLCWAPRPSHSWTPTTTTRRTNVAIHALSDDPRIERPADGSLASSDEQLLRLRNNQQHQRFLKSMAQQDRLAALELKQELSPAEQAEQSGLLSKANSVFEEPYHVDSFSSDHRAFKLAHNRAFARLAAYCQEKLEDEDDDDESINLFFLDGPDAGTASELLLQGGRSDRPPLLFQRPQCFVANRHTSTCRALVDDWGLFESNVAHSSASDALRTVFGAIKFQAVYLDGCGSYVPLILDMLEAALLQQQPLSESSDGGDHAASSSSSTASTRLRIQPTDYAVLGFSIVGGGRDVVNKEQLVLKHLHKLVKETHKITHVMDDPEQWGIILDDQSSWQKLEGPTLTTFVLLEPHCHDAASSRRRPSVAGKE